MPEPRDAAAPPRRLPAAVERTLSRLPPGAARFAGQLLRYGLGGTGVNAALYLAYLAITALGMAPVAAATVCFAAGIPLSLGVHARFTFRAGRVSRGRALGFAALYGAGYVTQIGTLALLYRGVGLPHQVAQLVAMGVVALLLFVLQKRFVFRA